MRRLQGRVVVLRAFFSTLWTLANDAMGRSGAQARRRGQFRLRKRLAARQRQHKGFRQDHGEADQELELHGAPGELLERPCAHLYETRALRRAHVRGHENVLKRLLVHASADPVHQRAKLASGLWWSP
jgi:hypothetical protein